MSLHTPHPSPLRKFWQCGANGRDKCLDRLFLSMGSILTTAPQVCHVDPIGGTVRGGFKTFRLNIGLQQKRLITIRLGQSSGKRFCASATFWKPDFYAHPAHDHKARVGHHLLQMTLTRRVTPADPTLARLQMQRRRTETQRSQPSLLAADQVAQLRATQRSIPQVVMGRTSFFYCKSSSRSLELTKTNLSPRNSLTEPSSLEGTFNCVRAKLDLLKRTRRRGAGKSINPRSAKRPSATRQLTALRWPFSVRQPNQSHTRRASSARVPAVARALPR